MLFAWRKPDDITGPDFLNRTSLVLNPTQTGGDDQGLPLGMRVPCGSSAGLERNTRGGGTRGSVDLE